LWLLQGEPAEVARWQSKVGTMNRKGMESVADLVRSKWRGFATALRATLGTLTVHGQILTEATVSFMGMEKILCLMVVGLKILFVFFVVWINWEGLFS